LKYFKIIIIIIIKFFIFWEGKRSWQTGGQCRRSSSSTRHKHLVSLPLPSLKISQNSSHGAPIYNAQLLSHHQRPIGPSEVKQWPISRHQKAPSSNQTRQESGKREKEKEKEKY
jgi:hypothetical protein